MARKLSFGLNLAGFAPAFETARLSKLAEDQGFDYVWIADENPSPLCRDISVNMTTAALQTSRIQIGTGICNFYTRHPALLAVLISTLEELAGKRIILGVGPGGDMPLRPLGIKMWEKPLATVREGILVANLIMKGDTVNYAGEMVEAKEVHLAFAPKRKVPIYLAARSPKFISIVGELADGSLLNTPFHYIEDAMAMITEGAQKAGRSINEVDVGNILPFAVSDSDDEARRKVRHLTTFMSAFTSDQVHERLGTKLERIHAVREELGKGANDKAASFMTNDMIDEFSIAGTRRHCLERVEAFFEAGVTQMIFVIPEDDEGIRSAGAKIISSFEH